MNALAASILGLTLLSPVRAPVPPEAPPDPLARAAIGVGADETTLQITTIYPNMPASKAGIRTGDRIVRVGKLQPHSFREVVNQVCSYRPGAVIEIEVERGTERKVFSVKLVPRPPDFDTNRNPYPLPLEPPER